MSGPVERTTATRRVSVDHALCSGTGHCAETVPAVFRLADRRAWLRPDADLDAADAQALVRAETICPWMAVTFERQEST
ncbi:ferredoxin [Streptomyces catenulae]|uniref:(4Fe-4S)-binding protein n=1 Tax=Streptomyces catenulae TaxID=66875 RepID=A0ABV2Z687_9ACTN|nr:(4Fe-4S)-binding protein [Streptomyces catenulae]